jgi:hypothetical protein
MPVWSTCVELSVCSIRKVRSEAISKGIHAYISHIDIFVTPKTYLNVLQLHGYLQIYYVYPSDFLWQSTDL